MTVTQNQRFDFKDAAEAAAWDEGKDCPTCEGRGRLSGGRRVVHCSGRSAGADWAIEEVCAAIDQAVSLRWVDGFMDHDLEVVTPDGKTWRFQVKRPDTGGGRS